MCVECIKEECPDRGSICLESGSYLMNFARCSQCKTLDMIKIVNKVATEDANEEFVSYQHVCQSCEHVIATHEYSFRIEDEYQIYEMECMLCGHAEDQRSILPYDPRGPQS